MKTVTLKCLTSLQLRKNINDTLCVVTGSQVSQIIIDKMSIMPLCLAGEVVNGMTELLMAQTMLTISEKQLVVSESVQVWFKVSILGIKIPSKIGSFFTKTILKI